jgi:lipopolysaccharide export system ATP-binding protein
VKSLVFLDLMALEKQLLFYMIVGLVQQILVIFTLMIWILPITMYKRAQQNRIFGTRSFCFRKLSIEDNILSVLQLTKLSKEGRSLKWKVWLPNLAYIHTNRGDLLSGERRRTEIARCLATDPKFILLDEPFAGVDP